MRIVAIDPSTSAIGYCVCDALPWSPVEFGTIRPDRPKESAVWRIRAMEADVITVLDQYGPVQAVVEIPSRNHARFALRSGGTGAATYGLGVGYTLHVVDAWFRLHRAGDIAVHTVTANEWKNAEAKTKLVDWLCMEFPQFADRLRADKGGDMADAIGLSRWFSMRLGMELPVEAEVDDDSS